MTRHQMLIAATAVVASVGITACAGQESSSPTAPSISVASRAGVTASSRPGTVLRVTKECSMYTGHAGDFCTITSSSLNSIKVGSRVIYASDAGANGRLDTDIVIDLPGEGRHAAFGHCSVDLATGDGTCTLAGGIGKFEELSASVVVSHLDGPNYGWEGTYRVGSKRD